MNKLKKYEQLIADKLQQIPVPDTETSWQQMKQLLDEEQPTRRGGGWKWTAILAVVVTIGLWWLAEANKPDKNQIAVTVKQPANNSLQQPINKINDNNTTSKIATTNNNNETLPNDNKMSNGAIAVIPAEINKNNLPNNNTGAGNVTSKADKPDTDTDTDPVAAQKSIVVKQHSSTTYDDAHFTAKLPKKSSIKKDNAPSVVLNADKKQDVELVTGSTPNKNSTVQKPPKRKRVINPTFQNTEDEIANVGTGNVYKSTIIANSEKELALIQKQNILLENWNDRKIPLERKNLNTASPANTIAIIEKDEALIKEQLTKTAIAQKQKLLQQKEQEKLVKKIERRDRLHNGLGNMFKPFSLKAEGEPWWAVGLSLNNAVSTGSQTKYNYNVNAKKNVALDFLPSPYVQYHINSNVYLQTELNLSAPQYTPQIYISRNNFLSAGNSIEQSVFVQKLYYFNWPVSLHYSPVNNLYIGAGVQFSSLQSGLLQIQEKNTATNQLVRNSVLKFKDDSAAARFNTNEWRWQTGADYYWNRFTLGLRYNKSFRNLFSQNTGPIDYLPYNNKSFLLFVKYNLFEGRKKETSQYKSTTRY
jgi:hypothetical protein